MKLSTKSTYGLRAMLNIALGSNGEAISITDISRREGISASYLEQLLNKLRHDGLIESIRGPKGGYVLSKEASDITVADVVRTLEGGIYPVHCVGPREKTGNLCKKSSGCVPKIVWHKLAKAINDCLGSITLQDMCAEAKKINKA
jgi:Rrf2 family protein